MRLQESIFETGSGGYSGESHLNMGAEGARLRPNLSGKRTEAQTISTKKSI